MREILEYDPPPELSGFYRLTPLEKAAFVYYYTLYKQWLPSVEKFKMVFNREFYKLRCEGFGELDALEEIRKRTEAEWKWKRAKENKRAYERSRKHLFSDERATPDSRYGPHFRPLQRLISPNERALAKMSGSRYELHRSSSPGEISSRGEEWPGMITSRQ